MIVMGRHSYLAPTTHIYHDEECCVRIGNFTSIALDVECIPAGRHHLEWVTSFPIRRIFNLPNAQNDDVPSKGDIIIGNDVWIGRGAKIVGPVNIGDGAVIGAYSVVAKDIPPYAIVVGSPATIKKFRFDKEIYEKLLEIRWWDWEDDLIISRLDDINSPDIQSFINKYERKDK